jgi:hypothetical protein
MRQQVVGGILALTFALTPIAVMAQATALDPEVRATVELAVKEVAALLAPGAISADSGTTLLQPTPEPTEESVEVPALLPELNLTDLAEYSSGGVTIQVPVDWIVEASNDETAQFSIEIPDTELFISLEEDSAVDFPSLLALALFRSQAELLVADFAEEAQIDEPHTAYTAQGLPMAKLGFSGNVGGVDAAGLMYIAAPNQHTYLLVAGGPPDEWAQVAEGIDLIAESMVFDEDLVTLVAAGDEPLAYTDADATVEFELPAGWYAMNTGDSQFPVVAAEPEVRYVVTMGNEESFGEDVADEILALYDPEGGELDSAASAALINELLGLLGDSNDMTLDAEQSTVFRHEGGLMFQLVGGADMGDGISLPVILYLDIRETTGAIAAVFGDTEFALADGEIIESMVQSVTRVE